MSGDLPDHNLICRIDCILTSNHKICLKFDLCDMQYLSLIHIYQSILWVHGIYALRFRWKSHQSIRANAQTGKNFIPISFLISKSSLKRTLYLSFHIKFLNSTNLNLSSCSIPVSYTHLDVYKRQFLLFYMTANSDPFAFIHIMVFFDAVKHQILIVMFDVA